MPYFSLILRRVKLTLHVCVFVFSSQNGLTGRLQWFARKLIAQHIHNLSSSTASANGTKPSSTPAANSRMSCADWLVHLKNPLEILKTVVLPVIAQNPKVHSLLADINQSLELLSLGL